MPSTVSFTAEHGQLPEEAIKELTASIMPTEEAMLYTAARQITRIRTRTIQGVDVDQQPFVPYSPAYAKQRLRTGRKTAPVDLTKSGRMFASMQGQVESPKSFAIAVTDVDAAVYGQAINDGSGHQPERRFFDTSDPELAEMQKDLIGLGSVGKP